MACAATVADALEAAASLPQAAAAAYQKMRAIPSSCSVLHLCGLGLTDEHLPPLVQVLHHSENTLGSLDLSFNRIGDAGAALLCKMLSAGGAPELTVLHLGGNPVSAGAQEAALSEAARTRPEVAVDFEPTLRRAQKMCDVGIVYKSSPAKGAGLCKGDAVLAFGPLQRFGSLNERFGFQPDFQGDREGSEALRAQCIHLSVLESISPLVRTSIGAEIHVVVEREAEREPGTSGGSGKQHLALTLVPARWDGSGLLGCILK